MKWIRLLGLACVVAGCSLAPSAAFAGKESSNKEQPNPGAPSFVDLGRLLGEYRKTAAFTKFQGQLREQAKKFDEEMQTLAQLRYCTEEERAEGLMLKGKPKPSAMEKSRLEVLLKKADTLDNEIATLSQKTKPTEAESARLIELSKTRTEAARTMAREQADRRDQLRKMESGLMADVETELLKLIEKVAKDQKLPAIYERRSVLFGGNDITDFVVKKLPK
jgi:Skp family chaperone for outer membrane proteins